MKYVVHDGLAGPSFFLYESECPNFFGEVFVTNVGITFFLPQKDWSTEQKVVFIKNLDEILLAEFGSRLAAVECTWPRDNYQGEFEPLFSAVKLQTPHIKTIEIDVDTAPSPSADKTFSDPWSDPQEFLIQELKVSESDRSEPAAKWDNYYRNLMKVYVNALPGLTDLERKEKLKSFEVVFERDLLNQKIIKRFDAVVPT